MSAVFFYSSLRDWQCCCCSWCVVQVSFCEILLGVDHMFTPVMLSWILQSNVYCMKFYLHCFVANFLLNICTMLPNYFSRLIHNLNLYYNASASSRRVSRRSSFLYNCLRCKHRRLHTLNPHVSGKLSTTRRFLMITMLFEYKSFTIR